MSAELKYFQHETERRNPKAVIILFPDIRTTGGRAEYSSEYIPLLVEDFREKTGKLLNRYRREGYKTFAFVYQNTGKEQFSYLYPKDKFEEIIKWDKAYGEWGNNANFHEVYKNDFPNIEMNMNLGKEAKVVVGGYHARDCVLNFAKSLNNNGFKAEVDLRLTDELPFLLISHRLRKSLPQGMLSQHMNEDREIWNLKKQNVG